MSSCVVANMESDSYIIPPSLGDDMQPVLWILQLLTVAPLSIRKGRVDFSWRSWPMAWSIASFIVMSIYAVYVFTLKYSDLFVESRSFSDVIFFLTFLELLHHHFVSPIVHWPEAQGLATYFQSWDDFQKDFKKMTGSPLHLGLRRLCWRHLALTLLVPALLCVVSTHLLKPIRGVELLPFISSGMFHAIMPRTWNVLGLAVVRAGECLQESFDVAMAKEGANAAPSVKAFRRLWTKLRRLAETPGICWGVTTLHYLLYSLVILMSTTFGCMTALQQGYLTARGQTLVCFVVDNLSHLLTLCTAGYSSNHAMVGVVVTYMCVLAQFGATVNALFE